MSFIKKTYETFRTSPILRTLVWIVLAIAAMLIVAHYLMQLGTRHGARCAVPDFTGVAIGDAEHLAKKHDLEIIVNDSLYVPVYDGGIVLEQNPKADVAVKPGRKVYVTINAIKQRMVTVPYVAGRSLRQAKNLLEMAGLTIERLEYVEDIATNYVLAEFVDNEEVLEESDLQVEFGSGVVLRVGVSGGYALTTVPYIVGRSLHEAKSRLWEAGLNVGELRYDESVEVIERNRAKVCWQSALPTTNLALGSDVSLQLSLDGERIDGAVAEFDKRLADMERAKMEADSIAKAEQRLLDSIANAEKPQPQQAPQTQDDFFF